MPADQAAGLRRRRAQHPPCCIHCYFDAAESTTRLAQALHRRGWTSLLLDSRGRVFADSPTRSLFDWRQQIARGQPQMLPMPYGDGWHVPGMQGDEPALMTIADTYDSLLFDASLDVPDWTSLPGAARIFVIEVNAASASVLRAYTLLKALSNLGGCASIALLGDVPVCDRLLAACGQFLGHAFAQAVYSIADEVDEFAALAIRMTAEETSLTVRYRTGNT